MAKTYAATYLYGQYSEYEKQIFSFIMTGSEIDKDTSDFDDIKYEVKKRQVSNSLVKVLESKDVILMSNEVPLSKAFKVFCAKDLKGPKKNKMKVFIDCSNIIKRDESTGRFVCRGNNIDMFISYLVSAMHTLIYYADESRIVTNNKIMSVGAQAFALLFAHTVDYVCKISAMPSSKNKCMYLASLYYLGNILGKDYTTDGCRKIAKKISGLSDREASIVDIQLKQESMMNIKFFVETVSSILHLNKLTLDVVVERWMSIYGTGTVFALEIFPAFASMITDAYVGAYLNNQKTIEKIAGTTMTEYTKILLQIGAEAV
jgi:hypothetical protein